MIHLLGCIPFLNEKKPMNLLQLLNLAFKYQIKLQGKTDLIATADGTTSASTLDASRDNGLSLIHAMEVFAFPWHDVSLIVFVALVFHRI